MIHKLFFLVVTTLILGCEDQSYLQKDDKNQKLTTSLIELRDGIAYLPENKESFTGIFVYYCSDEKLSDPVYDLSQAMEILELSSYQFSNEIKNDNKIKGTNKKPNNKSVCISESYINGIRNGITTTIERDSKQIYNFKDGVLNGINQLICLKDTVEKECALTNYKNGKRSGINKSYKNDGVLYSVNINLGETSEDDIKLAMGKLDEDRDKIENHSWYKDRMAVLDEITKKYSKNNEEATRITAYIGRWYSDNTIRIRYKFEYKADSWLFINSIIIAADNERFEKQNVTFERNNDIKGIREWYDILALDEDLKIMKAIINSKETTIRFKGNTEYSDYIVTTQEKAALKNVVEAYETLISLST